MKEELQLFMELCDVLLQSEEEHPIVAPVKIPDLFKKLDLSLKATAELEENFISGLKELIKATPKTATNRFFNQLYGGRVPKAVLGDLLAVMLNTSMYTYKVAGPQIGVEKVILQASKELIGYPDSYGGTIASGGSMSNFISLILARDAKLPETSMVGVNRTFTLYTSEACHYSIGKNAALSGIGRNNVRYVKTDARGCMLVSDLETQIEKDIELGNLPFFINATAGTTVLGAFDPIKEIAKISSKYGLWFHVDGAYCGSVIFSNSYNHLVEGIELSDSFNYNAHKMLGTPMTCSIFLCKEKKFLYNSLAADADYLFQTAVDDFNPGKTSLQCGRRNDALKLWTLWKSIGTEGLGKMVDHQFKMADFARKYIQANPNYTLYSYEKSISVCFNYKDYNAKKLCHAMYEKAKFLVSFGENNGTQFVRLVTINSILQQSDILNFFSLLEQFADTEYHSSN
ncbi:pyridoxal phosphate-dependent decarboxylase family protein [Aegicerativicinus sediminis]|uniref:pyridoxal phosphate-dependent decarboxylase family protein n=1 Tax=Aegicerativicinus sediminis TaxID=2893202 RepID=UPI001E3DFADB|nr:pyridoxal-dependent decarboxylase [Aegicerativicinus sediminis]